MKDTKPMSLEEASEPEISYFGLQAYVGTTKHMGGLETTKELIVLCGISKDTYVLDVGCGVGATACYLAKRYSCRVVGVDLRESMIARSNERAQREGVEGTVEFRVADAQDLSFADAQFDVVLCESVATFIEDKQRVVNELARVTKPGGYVGMNEEIWIKEPPARLIEFVKRTWDIEPDVLTSDGWVGLLRDAGLKDIVAKAFKFNVQREATQVRRYRWEDMLRMFYRTLVMYLKNPAFRQYMKDHGRLPKSTFEYLGYGLFVGRR